MAPSAASACQAFRRATRRAGSHHSRRDERAAGTRLCANCRCLHAFGCLRIEVRGLRNTYRRAGIGAALSALANHRRVALRTAGYPSTAKFPITVNFVPCVPEFVPHADVNSCDSVIMDRIIG